MTSDVVIMLSDNKSIANCIKDDMKIDIIGTMENLSDINIIPESYGTYIIIAQSGKRYIGSSINLSRRIKQHRAFPYWHKDPIKAITIFLTWDEIDARRVEDWLISKLDPEINKEYIVTRKTRIGPRLSIDGVKPYIVYLIYKDKTDHGHLDLADTLGCIVRKAMGIIDDSNIDDYIKSTIIKT